VEEDGRMGSHRRAGPRNKKRRTSRKSAAQGRGQEESVNHPSHYGGADNPYEVVKVAEAWGLDKDAYLFNVIKYIGRNGKKEGEPPIKDLKKAAWYLNRRITNLEKA
jgi:hypothetical protein